MIIVEAEDGKRVKSPDLLVKMRELWVKCQVDDYCVERDPHPDRVALLAKGVVVELNPESSTIHLQRGRLLHKFDGEISFSQQGVDGDETGELLLRN